MDSNNVQQPADIVEAYVEQHSPKESITPINSDQVLSYSNAESLKASKFGNENYNVYAESLMPTSHPPAVSKQSSDKLVQDVQGMQSVKVQGLHSLQNLQGVQSLQNVQGVQDRIETSHKIVPSKTVVAPIASELSDTKATQIQYNFVETTLIISPSLNAKLIQGSGLLPLVMETAISPEKNTEKEESITPIQDSVTSLQSVKDTEKSPQDIVETTDGYLAPPSSN